MGYSREKYNAVADEVKEAEKKLAELEEISVRNDLSNKGNFLTEIKSRAQRRLKKSAIESGNKALTKLHGVAEVEAHAFNELLDSTAEAVIKDLIKLEVFLDVHGEEVSKIHEGILAGKIAIDASSYPIDDGDAERILLQQERILRNEIATKIDKFLDVLKENYYNAGFLAMHDDEINEALLKDFEQEARKRISESQYYGPLGKNFDETVKWAAQRELQPYLQGVYGKFAMDRFNESKFQKAQQIFPVPESYTRLYSLSKRIEISMPLNKESADIGSVKNSLKELQEELNVWRIPVKK